MSEYAEPEHPTDASPAEDAPQAGREVAPEEPASLPLPGLEPEPYEPPEPLEPAEPGIYVCEGEYGGIHPVLKQTIQHGENDFTKETNPDVLLAVAALVRDGVLTGPM